MSEREITFDDGEAYERFMGRWSRLAGEVFLDWLEPHPGLRWIDVGCGNGAFTELLFERASPAHVGGVDPSAAQLAFAQARLNGRAVTLEAASAESLPFPDLNFDASVMALVIFFVPAPERGVAEMVRVTRPGGFVGAYAWDIQGGGFPTEPVADALRAFGIEPPRPPRADVSTIDALTALWVGAGLVDLATRTISVEREFLDFEDWWASARGAPRMGAELDRLTPAAAERLRDLVRELLPVAADGRIRTGARANAIRGTRV